MEGPTPSLIGGRGGFQVCIMVDIFTNDTIYTVVSFVVLQTGPFIVPIRQNYFSNFFLGYEKFFGRFAFSLVPEGEAPGSKIVL